MKIYFVYDGWDETSVWEIKFYATKELAEQELDAKIAKVHEQSEFDYQRKIEQWQTKHDAKMAIVAAGLPVPSELSWLTKPEKKVILNHGLCIDYVEVIEE